MTFEEIFKEEGLYKSDTFAKGVALEIKKNTITGHKELFIKTFTNENDLMPETVPFLVYDGMFKKEYTHVYTRQSLFL